MDSVSLTPDAGFYFPFDHPQSMENTIVLRNHEKGEGQQPGSVGGTSTAPTRTKATGFLVFRLRATKPDCYTVRPRLGVLYPDSSRPIRVALKNISQTELEELRGGRTKHCFQLDVRRVTDEQTLNEIIELITGPSSSSASAEKKSVELIRDLFEASSQSVRQWTLNTHFSLAKYQWVLGGHNAEGHSGVILEKNEKGETVNEIPASISLRGSGGSGSVEPSRGRSPSHSHRSLTPSRRDLVSIPREEANAKGGGVIPTPQIRRLEEQVEDKKVEETRLKAELLALKNQTAQLQSDCDAVVKVSTSNAKKLDSLEREAASLKQRHVQWVSLPVPVMIILVLSTFVLALALRPAGKGANDL